MKDIKYFDPRDPGWMNDEELAKIREVTKGRGEVLEIGCYCGRTTRVLLESTTGFVVCIDPLHRNGWMPRWPKPDGAHLDAHAHMADLVEQYHFKLIVIPAFSREMYKLFRRAVDVLVIDSSHSYPDTVDEVNGFAPLVRDGGVIIFDDYDIPPVKAGWLDSKFKKDHPWLVVEEFNSLGIVKIVLAPPPEGGNPLPDPTTATPVG